MVGCTPLFSSSLLREGRGMRGMRSWAAAKALQASEASKGSGAGSAPSTSSSDALCGMGAPRRASSAWEAVSPEPALEMDSMRARKASFSANAWAARRASHSRAAEASAVARAACSAASAASAAARPACAADSASSADTRASSQAPGATPASRRFAYTGRGSHRSAAAMAAGSGGCALGGAARKSSRLPGPTPQRAPAAAARSATSTWPPSGSLQKLACVCSLSHTKGGRSAVAGKDILGGEGAPELARLGTAAANGGVNHARARPG